ncbi:MAG: dksA [Frankiales bacterium]|jgi:DnaK suppressor protein|nr:dksA [Frankiales bacterium]
MDPLLTARGNALAQIAALTAARAEIVAAAEGSNADDEHDPEGATIAFERQQVAALLEQAHASLASVDAALARRSSGSYGVCTGCGGVIGADRLEARPSATLCIACARRQSGRR